jgi:1,3-beta-glucanosyltransferase GAS1
MKIGLVDIVGGINVTVRPNYLALSSQLAQAHPSPTTMLQYQQTNTAPSVCYAMKWETTRTNSANGAATIDQGELSTELPQQPNRRMCFCMMDTLQCVSTTSDSQDWGLWQSLGCASSEAGSLCNGVRFDTANGIHGPYAGCNASQVRSWLLHQMFILNGSDTTKCSSAGGYIQTPIPSVSRQADCKTYLRQVGPDATGRVTFTPTADLMKVAENSQAFSGGRMSFPSKIGIGVGVSIFTVLILILAVGSIARRRRKKQAKPSETEPFSKAELPDSTKIPSEKFELDSPGKYELDGQTHFEAGGEERIELESPGQSHELGSAGHGIFEMDTETKT